MACGAERVQPSIIGGSVRLVEPRPRAHSPTHAAPSARGGPQSKHPQLTRDASRGPSRIRAWVPDRGDPAASSEIIESAEHVAFHLLRGYIRCASLLGSQMRALFWRELGADGDPA